MTGSRRALSNLGGPTESRGDPAFAIPLVAAMEAQSAPADTLTHGFHAHPARMHPSLAGTLLDALSPGPGATVLDPFCGSGTVAIEAMCRGWHSLNSDLDPLAIRLARVKSEIRKRASRETFLRRAEAIGEASQERVRERVPARAELTAQEREWYDVHVLKEMAGLLEEIRRVDDRTDRRALEMVFSSLVVKFSRQRSETVQQATSKRIRKGLVSEFFVRKAGELCERWAALQAALPPKPHRPRFVVADARALPATLSGEFRCDLVLTSPPYGGIYDYASHHARRHAWLGLASGDLERHEIGARRRLGRGPRRGRDDMNREPASRRWDREIGASLAAIAELLVPAGVAIVVIGDGALDGAQEPADRQVERLAPEVGLEFLAAARQERPGAGARPEHHEHLVALLRR